MRIQPLLSTVSANEQALLSLRRAICEACQPVYDGWSQDEEGWDDEYGTDGICDTMAAEIAQVLGGAGFDVVDGGHEGDDHAWCIAVDHTKREAFGVDIPAQVYETGGGYNWRKKPGVQFTPDDVKVWPLKYDDVVGPQGEALESAEQLVSGADGFMSAPGGTKAVEILKAMINLNPLKITYRDRHKRATRRVVEPYRLTTYGARNMPALWAYCLMRDSYFIRVFYLHRMLRVENLISQNFKPRWDVDVPPGEPWEKLAKEMAEDMGVYKPKKKKR